MELGEYIYSEQDLIDVDDLNDLPTINLNQFKSNLETYNFLISELIKRTTDIKQLDLLECLKNPRYELNDNELWDFEEILNNNEDLRQLNNSKTFAIKELEELYKKSLEDENKPLDIKELLTMEVNIDWIFEGMKPKTVGFITGSGGSMKSRLVLQMLCSLATGVDFIGIMKNPKKQKVSYITTEDDKQECALRLQNIKSNCNLKTTTSITEIINDLDSNLNIYSKTGKAPSLFRQGEGYKKVETTEHLKWLDNIASKSRLVVLDPLSHFIGCLDENSNTDMGLLMSEIKGIASKNNCAILILHHISKGSVSSGDADKQQSTRGASSLVDTSRLVLALTNLTDQQITENGIDEKDKSFFKVLTLAKSNYIKPQEPIILKSINGVFRKFDKEDKTTFEYQKQGLNKRK